MKPAAHVAYACEHNLLVGSQLRSFLVREITTKILFRNAKDIVLLSGATGSGKEKTAHVCHLAASQHLGRKGPLVQVNCANLGQGLFESELFGYKKGAFTGADKDSQGLVHHAQHGTLVLDEIQSLTLSDQARLLRFLGEREYRTLGDHHTKTSNALIILSTNALLHENVRNQTFRRDLLDRATAKIHIPPLFERPEDIAELADVFAQEAAQELDAAPFYGLTRQSKDDLEAAITHAKEVSVRRLREIVRNAVFSAAEHGLPSALESDFLKPLLEKECAYTHDERRMYEINHIENTFNALIGLQRLEDIAQRHGVSMGTLRSLCQAIQHVIEEMDAKPKSYRNVIETTQRLSKVALWIVSGAHTQAEFRRFFGHLNADMPTKSVAHQIFYDVFPPSKKSLSA